MAVAGIVLVADVEACDGTGQQQCGGDQLALALLFEISTYAVLNWRYPSGFKVPKRSRMICFYQSINSNGFSAQRAFVCVSAWMNATT